MNINKLVRKNIKELKPYSSARGSFLDGVLLDANENSFGSVLDSNLALNRYPDPNQVELRKAISTYLNIDYKNIFFGVGSDEIIDLLIRIFCEPRIDNVIICEPTYGMYKVACDINAIQTKTALLNKNYDIDINEIEKSIDGKTKMIFLCSPNNPTGNLLSIAAIKKVLKIFYGIMVIDEAYIDFAAQNAQLDLLKEYPNVVLIRTFSKAWGAAGVRCGYAMTNKEIIDILFKVKAPYNINKLTANYIINSLKQHKEKDKFVKRIIAEREKVIAELSSLQGVLKVFPSQANYILFKVKNADNIYSSLIERGIIIRNRSNQIKLGNCLRVSIGTPKENKLFLKELKKLL